MNNHNRGLIDREDLMGKEKKHMPVIDAPDKVKRGEPFNVKVTVGDGINLFNRTLPQHHIRWIEVFFQAKDEKFPQEIRTFKFNISQTPVPECAVSFKIDKPGIIFASSYCDLHGLLQNSKDILITE